MQTKIHLSAVPLGLILCSTWAMAQTGPAPAHRPSAAEPTGLYEQALELHRQGRMAAAYGRLAWLADQGHVQAAQLAWWMHRHGALLYGSDWYASQAQQRAWAAQLPSPSPQPSDDSRD